MAVIRKTVVTETVEYVVAAGVAAPVVEVAPVPAPALPAPRFRRGDKVRYAARGRSFKTYYVVRLRDDGKVQITSPDRRISFPVEPGRLYHSQY